MHVFAEVADMIPNRGLETFTGAHNAFQKVFEVVKEGVEGVVLDPVEKLFLAGHIVVDAREAYLCLGGKAPHGGSVEAYLREDSRRRLQKMKPFGVETRSPVLGGMKC
jgi:hypothetical protein